MDLKKIYKKISAIAEKNKTPIYAVGGFVRDLLMDKQEFKDIDFVVEGSGIDFAEKFDKAMKEQGRLVIFPDFDTARYLFFDEQDKIFLELEFAGARKEQYKKSSRKPKVLATDLEQDLLRRDFTINAMALPIEKINENFFKKHIIDRFNGKQDLEDKIIRTPLDPNETFIDDPLRMIRAMRFSAQLNFSIEPQTLEAIYKNRERIKIVSAERIQEELLKILSCDMPSVALNLMFQTHLLDLILPEVAQLDGVEEIYGHQHKNNMVHTFKVVDNISLRTDKAILRLAGLLHDIGKFATKHFIAKTGWTFYQHEHVGKKLVYRISKRLRLSKKDTDYLAKMVRWHQQPISLMDDGITDSAVRRLIVNLEDDLDDLLILGISDITTGNPYKLKKRQDNYERLRKRIDEVMEKDKLRAFQSPIRGEEIMKQCNLKPGPTVGKIKKDIEEAILDGIIPNEYEPAKIYFEKIKGKYLESAGKWEII
ncbi:MAG: HD domain-containing protein [bacterium]